jgi:TGS domain.
MNLLRKSLFKRAKFLSFPNFFKPISFFSSIQGKRVEEATPGKIHPQNEFKIGGFHKPNLNLASFKNRIDLFNEIYEKQQEKIKAAQHREIDIILKDGKVIKGKSWETTPMEIAKKISKKLAEKVVVAQISYIKRDVGPFATSKYFVIFLNFRRG